MAGMSTDELKTAEAEFLQVSDSIPINCMKHSKTLSATQGATQETACADKVPRPFCFLTLCRDCSE